MPGRMLVAEPFSFRLSPGCPWERHAPARLREPGWSPAFQENSRRFLSKRDNCMTLLFLDNVASLSVHFPHALRGLSFAIP
jgi:hypothetical protein